LARQLKIGKATIGLLGLDTSLAKALREQMGEAEAVDYMYEVVAAQNYIPPAGRDLYRHALRQEYRRQAGLTTDSRPGLTIKILGPGCVSCNRINAMIFDILQKLQLAADIVQIHDLDEIWRHGVLNTPALIINDRIMSSGRHPSSSEVEQWIRESVDQDSVS